MSQKTVKTLKEDNKRKKNVVLKTQAIQQGKKYKDSYDQDSWTGWKKKISTEKSSIQISADFFEARSFNILQNQPNDNGKTRPEDQNSYWKMKYENLVEERKGFLKSLSELLDCRSCQRRLPFNAERIQCCSNGHVICDTCSSRPSFGCSYGGASCRLTGSER